MRQKLVKARAARAVALCVVFAFGWQAMASHALGSEASEPFTEEHSCLLQPHSVVQLSSQVQGLLASISVERGDSVSKGQVVARLESRFEQAAVETARAQAENDSKIRSAETKLVFLNSQLKRKLTLWKKDLMPLAVVEKTLRNRNLAEIEVKDALVDMKLAKIALERAQQRLRQRSIRSPIKGVVVDRFLSTGEYAKEQSAILKVARLDILTVRTFVPISRYGSIKVGMGAEIRPQSPIGGRFKAVVKLVDKVLDGASQTFEVRLELRNRNLSIPAQTRCRLVFVENEITPPPMTKAPSVSFREVSDAQKLLATLGYRPGPADGTSGGKTKRAIRAYQRISGFAVDGHVTWKLLSRLKATAALLH